MHQPGSTGYFITAKYTVDGYHGISEILTLHSAILCSNFSVEIKNLKKKYEPRFRLDFREGFVVAPTQAATLLLAELASCYVVEPDHK